MTLLVIYDDSGRKSEVITDIIGEKGFGDVVIQKRHLEDYYKEIVQNIYQKTIWRRVNTTFEFPQILKELELYNTNETRVIHCFSNYMITDPEAASLSIKKLAHIDDSYGVLAGKRAVAAMFPDVLSYMEFCKSVLSGQKAWDLARNMKETFEIEGMTDIGIVSNFIQCVTGSFDSRYFNSVKGNDYTITKSSSNKHKIKAEYTFYHLLPEDMKYWFVLPFNFQETQDHASYMMERLHMTDLSIKWVHGSMDETEFEELMDKYFFFFESRHRKEVSKQEYLNIANSLYIDKVQNRIQELKNKPEFARIQEVLYAASRLDIDDLLKKYLSLKEKIEAGKNYKKELVIGHGDPCFANALYNRSTKTLKFIDPKGALKEEELWTNPYYDIAKLSHSVCGRYDYFNSALFDIKINPDFSLDLEIPFDNSQYVEVFKKKVEKMGFDYVTVRIYEVSLFLSMLPLHIDNPHKVLGFILNANNIMEQIEKNV